MTQAAGTSAPGAAARGRPRLPHLTLNDDGQRHPMENSLSVFTLVAGIVACVLGFLAYQDVSGAWTHVGATWLGLIALIVGLPAQLILGDPVGADADRDRAGGCLRRRLPGPGPRRPAALIWLART